MSNRERKERRKAQLVAKDAAEAVGSGRDKRKKGVASPADADVPQARDEAKNSEMEPKNMTPQERCENVIPGPRERVLCLGFYVAISAQFV